MITFIGVQLTWKWELDNNFYDVRSINVLTVNTVYPFVTLKGLGLFYYFDHYFDYFFLIKIALELCLNILVRYGVVQNQFQPGDRKGSLMTPVKQNKCSIGWAQWDQVPCAAIYSQQFSMHLYAAWLRKNYCTPCRHLAPCHSHYTVIHWLQFWRWLLSGLSGFPDNLLIQISKILLSRFFVSHS